MAGSRNTEAQVAPGEDLPVRGMAWYALAILTLTYVVNNIDRSIMAILAEPVRVEFHLSDAQLGVLTGLALSLSYALAGLPLGLLVDRVNRRNLLAVLMTIWSVCTGLCGLAQSYWALVWARFAVGAAEAGASPTAMSMISDLFPKRRRSLAISIFWMSTAAGTATSFIFGSIVAVEFGWRAAFLVAGAPGLFLALVMILTVREPMRGAMDEPRGVLSASPPFLHTVRDVFRRPMVVHALIAMTLKSVMVSGVLVWTSSFLVRVQGLGLKEAGSIIGLSVAIFGALGSFSGGLIGDYAYRRGGLPLLPLAPAVTSVFTTISVVALALSPSWQIAVLAFVVFEILSRSYTAPGFNFVISSMPTRMRGVTTAAVTIGSTLGYGLGPLMAGAVSDRVGGPDSLRYGLLSLSALGLWVALHFFLSYRSARSTAGAGVGSRATQELSA